ncbi:MAG: hydroxymyristoyl-ACP dehydratase [Comamonadaceae bacterium]|nr:hydroxymyristoyl-ACP dehydratase [Comamonadaceae bacterium]
MNRPAHVLQAADEAHDAHTTRHWAQAAGQGAGWIAARIPHAGRMCLLDGVVRAAPQGIVCTAHSHAAVDHPLRQHGRLGAACGVEYAAQAMALHGALKMAAGQEGRALKATENVAIGEHPTASVRVGYLVSLRQLALYVARLDDVPGPLTVRAEPLADSGGHSVYAFALHAASGQPLLEGRAIVLLDAAPRMSSRSLVSGS